MQQLMKYNSNSKCENGSNETLFEMWQRWLPWKLHRTDWFNFSQIEKKRMSAWGLRRAWHRKRQMRVTSQCGCHAMHRSSINNRPCRCNQQKTKWRKRCSANILQGNDVLLVYIPFCFLWIIWQNSWNNEFIFVRLMIVDEQWRDVV